MFSELALPTTGVFACGISVDRLTTYCWGSNTAGQMGNGSTSPNRNPTPAAVSGQAP
jgi:hypothetical protein